VNRRDQARSLTRRQRRGLTLIEVVVAISIVVVMSVIVMQTMFNAAEMGTLLSERDATTRSARVTMSLLRRELQLAFISQSGASPDRYKTLFIHEDDNPDKLFFTTFSHQRLYRNSRESDQTEISIWATPGEGKGYTLWHRESPRIDNEMDMGGPIYPIAHNVRSFNVRFLDPKTNEWVDEWASNTADTAGLPRAAEIGLVLIGRDPNDRDRTVDIPFLSTVIFQYAPPLPRRLLGGDS